MELLYFKIFKAPGRQINIFNVDFNLHGKHEFKVDAITKIISYRKNYNYIEELYGSDISITAIAGKNGMGKTTFLKFAQNLISLLEEKENHQYSEYSHYLWGAIYVENGTLVYSENVVEINTFDIRYPDVEANVWRLDKKEIHIKDFEYIPIDNLSSSSIFYSPFFELEEITHDNPDFIDVSTDMLFYESKHTKELDEQTLSQIVNFRREEIKRQIDFIEKADSVLDEENRFYSKFVHKGIDVSFNGLIKKFVSDPRYIAFSEVQLYHEIDAKFLQARKGARSFLRGESVWDYEFFIARDDFYKRLIEILYYCFEHRPENLKTNEKGVYRLPILSEQDIELLGSKPYNELVMNFIDSVVFLDKDSLKRLIAEALELIKLFKSYDLTEEVFKYDLDAIKKLLTIEKKILDLIPYKSDLSIFSFNWPNLSTGEKAYLNIFSRLYAGYNKIRSNPKFSNVTAVYILIDEGSTGFHPQWQKEFLTRLINFSSKAIPIKKHFIITTHSPYPLSDLQIEDVISIGRSTNHTFHLTNTFAANIHELLADSFYLENTFMGDFSRKKIEQIGELLTGADDISENALIDIKKYISIIGEPVLKERLEFLYSKKSNERTNEQIISELRAEIEKLKAAK